MTNNNNQQTANVYTYLSMVQSLYSRYIQLKTKLAMLDNNLQTLSSEFDKLPTYPKFHAVQNAWNQKSELMQQIPQVVDNIVQYLIEATKLSLSALQISITTDNKFGIVLSDNTIASMCSLIEQSSLHLNIKELYKQASIIQGVSTQLNDIEIRARMNGQSIPSLEHLKTIIMGY